MGVLVHEVAALYTAFSTARPSPLAELPVQYADYAHWQREWLSGEVLAEQLSYWKRQLEGAPPVLELPTDHPRPVVQSFNGASEVFTLSRDLSDALKQLCPSEGVTLFMLLLAGFQTLLYRYTGQSGHRRRVTCRQPQSDLRRTTHRTVHKHSGAAHAPLRPMEFS